MSAENKINQIYIIRNSSEIRNINVKINIPSNFTYNKKKKNIRNFHLLMPQNLPPDLIFLQPAVPWQFFRVTLINYSFPSLPPRVIYHLFTFESEPLYILNLMGIKMSPLSRVYPFNRRSERSLSLSLSLSPSLSSGNVAESLLCSSKRGRRPWANKSNGPAGQNRFPFRKLKLAAVQIAHALQK